MGKLAISYQFFTNTPGLVAGQRYCFALSSFFNKAKIKMRADHYCHNLWLSSLFLSICS